jgi:hypothetical protein
VRSETITFSKYSPPISSSPLLLLKPSNLQTFKPSIINLLFSSSPPQTFKPSNFLTFDYKSPLHLFSPSPLPPFILTRATDERRNNLTNISVSQDLPQEKIAGD